MLALPKLSTRDCGLGSNWLSRLARFASPSYTARAVIRVCLCDEALPLRQFFRVKFDGGRYIIAFAACIFGIALTTRAHSQSLPPRTIPARSLPIPDTVGPALQRIIARTYPIRPPAPQTLEGWKALQKPAQDGSRAKLSARFSVTIVRRIIGGVSTFTVSKESSGPSGCGALLINLHAGGFIWGQGESGLFEAAMMSGITNHTVVAIDYRMPPEHPFPAAMDDVMAVWRQVIKEVPPTRIGVFGASAGGGMILAFIQRAKKENLPLPAALMADSPWADLSKTGDTYFTNAGVDNQFTYDEFWSGVARLYANGRDLRDPLVSPVYGDFSGFPPTFLVSGTRDAFLSNTVRVQRKLMQARVPTQLVVEEAQSHGWLILASMLEDAPEASELVATIGQFFSEHLCP